MAEEAVGKSLAGNLAERIRAVAERARNEEELRIGVEKLLEPALKELGITSQPRYEKQIRRTVFTAPGRSDAVYGQAIIEYEPPGKLSTQRGIASTQRQLERYLLAEASRSHDKEEAARRLAGIALDGRSIFFLRYRGDRPPQTGTLTPTLSQGERGLIGTQLPLLTEERPKGSFVIDGPYAVTEESIAHFLIHLRALRRLPLTPEALAGSFGPKGQIAHEVVNALYSRLEEALTTPGNPLPRVETLYDEWKRIFGIVYGQELVKASHDAEELARLYGIEEFTELKPLLFAVHTYFALLMKLLAAELLSWQTGSILASLATELQNLPDTVVQSRLADLEDGSYFAAQGIHNFLEADFFGWYLAAWNDSLAQSVRDLTGSLSEYEPATGSLRPEDTRDLLKRLYQYLVPPRLRHDLGEYYTPDWLAELVLNEVSYAGNPDHRILDPACGSGTFLVLAIRRIQDYGLDMAWRGRERELVARILDNVVGFDLNPLAVIAARTNYLLALGPLARYIAGRDLPVYLCDSILTPQSWRTLKRPLEHQKDIPVPSSQKEFWIPEELVEGGKMDGLCHLLERCVGRYTAEEFLALARQELGWQNPLTETSLVELYEKVQRLESDGRNGIWARIIKNAFAPVFRAATPFDFVVGNPPWVNWESLADDYRVATRELWQRYGLFSLRGHAARLGGGKKDIAMLMLYAAMDSYLRDGGKLGFVITQTVFKTKGAGDGFRRFRIGENGAYLGVVGAHDLSELQPFEGATNRTATVVLEKAKKTEYPANYTVWRKTKPGRVGVDLSLDEVGQRTKRAALSARPVNTAEPTSPWLTATPAALAALEKAVGPSEYQAHAGVYTGGLNGVYWLRILERRSDGLLVVENLHDVGKTKVKKLTAAIEPDLVYPLLRGRDVERWQAKPSAHILMVQDPIKRIGYDESWLKVTCPETHAYLKQFEDVLRSERRSQVVRDLMDKGAFYSMYAVAEYTFAPYKVVWRYVAEDFTCAVTEAREDDFVGERIGIPDHRLMIVPLTDELECHYLCSGLNSSIAQSIVKSYIVGTQISTHVLEHVAIPKFDAANGLHQQLAALSGRAHQLAAVGKEAEVELGQVEAEVDRLAAEMWGITKEELGEIRRALVELG